MERSERKTMAFRRKAAAHATQLPLLNSCHRDGLYSIKSNGHYLAVCVVQMKHLPAQNHPNVYIPN